MNENKEPVAPQEKQPKENMELLDWLYSAVSAVVIAILLCSFVIRPIYVVGSSMVPTLEERDLIMVSKLFYQPKYGDIVVLRKDSFIQNNIVKRVIATEGQTVDIDFVEGVVYVDGTALDEPYVNSLTLEAEDFTEPVTVPEGCVFVMGDNRNRSTDSRSARVGCVDARLIVGKALIRVTPLNKFGKI